MATTSKISTTEGSGKNIATYSISEDAVTKELQRNVLIDSTGAERGVAANPVQVSLANTGANTTPVKVDNSAVNQPVKGTTASGSSLTDNPVTTGGLAKTALPTAVSDGQVVNEFHDKFGRKVALIGTIRDLTGTQTTTISASTSETTIVTAGGAGVFNDLVMLIVSNTSSSTNTRIDFRDATAGSVLFSLQSNGGQPPIGFALPIPIPQTTANNNWTAQCATSTTDIRIYAVFAKNK